MALLLGSPLGKSKKIRGLIDYFVAISHLLVEAHAAQSASMSPVWGPMVQPVQVHSWLLPPPWLIAVGQNLSCGRKRKRKTIVRSGARATTNAFHRFPTHLSHPVVAPAVGEFCIRAKE